MIVAMRDMLSIWLYKKALVHGIVVSSSDTYFKMMMFFSSFVSYNTFVEISKIILKKQNLLDWNTNNVKKLLSAIRERI